MIKYENYYFDDNWGIGFIAVCNMIIILHNYITIRFMQRARIIINTFSNLIKIKVNSNSITTAAFIVDHKDIAISS
jgi:hypothetical protein